MQIELRCLQCCCNFRAPPDTPAPEVIDQMTEEGPWFALGDGDTFEDMIFAALIQRGNIRCPDCREPVAINEASMSRYFLETSLRC